MKRKIQHDAINNQEDEDSSAYSIYFPERKTADKKKHLSLRSGVSYFSGKDIQDQNKADLKRKY